MAASGAVSTWEVAEDPAYPGETPSSAASPRQTLEPLCPLFDGVAVPAIWSRLRSPLGRALTELWRALRIDDRVRPAAWVGLRGGHLVIDATGWERVEAALRGREPNPALVGPSRSGWAALTRPWIQLRMRRARRLLPLRVERAERRALAGLDRVEAIDVASLDTPPLARGPLDEWVWSEILMPWFVARGTGASHQVEAERAMRALRVEQRFAGELGRRLVNAGVLHKRGDVAYLTVEERIQAVVDGSELWTRVVEARTRRVAAFVDAESAPDRLAGSTSPSASGGRPSGAPSPRSRHQGREHVQR